MNMAFWELDIVFFQFERNRRAQSSNWTFKSCCRKKNDEKTERNSQSLEANWQIGKLAN